MFFRREKSVEPGFEDRLQMLRDSGFQVEPRADGARAITKDGCGALVRDVPGTGAVIEHAGVMIGGEIAFLVDAGFQKFWAVRGERRAPALASQLEALHGFEEDLREALGIESRFNESLGTTNDLHVYDRLEGRESGGRRPWQR